MDIFAHPDLPPELQETILARCDPPTLAAFAVANRAWCARVQRHLQARLARGLSIRLYSDPADPARRRRRMSWVGQQTCGEWRGWSVVYPCAGAAVLCRCFAPPRPDGQDARIRVNPAVMTHTKLQKRTRAGMYAMDAAYITVTHASYLTRSVDDDALALARAHLATSPRAAILYRPGDIAVRSMLLVNDLGAFDDELQRVQVLIARRGLA